MAKKSLAMKVDNVSMKFNLSAEKVDNIKTAILREKQLKGWSRAKKDALITAANPDWSELPPF